MKRKLPNRREQLKSKAIKQGPASVLRELREEARQNPSKRKKILKEATWLSKNPEVWKTRQASVEPWTRLQTNPSRTNPDYYRDYDPEIEQILQEDEVNRNPSCDTRGLFAPAYGYPKWKNNPVKKSQKLYDLMVTYNLRKGDLDPDQILCNIIGQSEDGSGAGPDGREIDWGFSLESERDAALNKLRSKLNRLLAEGIEINFIGTKTYDLKTHESSDYKIYFGDSPWKEEITYERMNWGNRRNPKEWGPSLYDPIEENPPFKEPSPSLIRRNPNSKWKTYFAPKSDRREPAFCHQCSRVFGKDEEVKINLEQGKMLCLPCFKSFKVNPCSFIQDPGGLFSPAYRYNPMAEESDECWRCGGTFQLSQLICLRTGSSPKSCNCGQECKVYCNKCFDLDADL